MVAINVFQYTSVSRCLYFPLIHALVHYSHGRQSAPLISRLRVEACKALLLPSSFPSSSPSVLFAILLPHRRVSILSSRYNLRISAALYPPPSCLLRLCESLPPLSTSSSSRTSFRTFAAILSRTYSLRLPSFVLPSALFLFQLPIHIVDLSFIFILPSSVSSLSLCVSTFLSFASL